jgi:hypothetical protein
LLRWQLLLQLRLKLLLLWNGQSLQGLAAAAAAAAAAGVRHVGALAAESTGPAAGLVTQALGHVPCCCPLAAAAVAVAGWLVLLLRCVSEAEGWVVGAALLPMLREAAACCAARSGCEIHCPQSLQAKLEAQQEQI